MVVGKESKEDGLGSYLLSIMDKTSMLIEFVSGGEKRAKKPPQDSQATLMEVGPFH